MIKNIKIKLPPEKLTPEKAALLGYLASDGSVGGRLSNIFIKKCLNNPFVTLDQLKKREYKIDILSKDLEIVENVQQLIFNIYKSKGSIKPRGNYWRFQIKNKKIFLDLLRYGFYDERGWRVPLEYMNDQGFIEFFKTFMDGDGTARNSKNKRFVSVSSVNYSGLMQIQVGLKKLGIESRIHFVGNKLPPRLREFVVVETSFYAIILRKNQEIKVHKSPYYLLVIEGQDNIKHLDNIIEGCFNLNRKRIIFKEILISYVHKSPKQIRGLILDALKKSKIMLSTSQIARLTKTKRNTTTKKYLEELRKKGLVKKLKLHDRKIVWGLRNKDYDPLTSDEKILTALKEHRLLTKKQLMKVTKLSHETVEDWLVKLEKSNKLSWEWCKSPVRGGNWKIWRLKK